MRLNRFLVHASILAIAVSLTDSVWAQAAPDVPSSANAARLSNPDRPLSFRLDNRAGARPGTAFSQTPAPDNADQIFLTLKKITLRGTEVYAPADLEHFWTDKVGSEIPLSEIYAIADRITKFYQDQGYILARAYIPAQEIESGEVNIAVAEGTIADVRFEGPFPVRGPLADALADLRGQSPLKIRQIERWTLHLNDFYGAQFRVVFKNAADLKEPALPADSVVIVLVGEKKKPVNAALTYDNSGSRYLGPNTVTATASINYGDTHFQRTQLSYTASAPTRELHMATIEHDIPLNARGLEAQFDAQKIDGRPGYSLKKFDIKSESKQFGAALQWAPIRQRDENLTLRGKFSAQNATTDIVNTNLSEDRVRVFRLSARYENLAPGAMNAGEIRLDKGLDGLLGASEKGDLNLSRAQGNPGFTKLGASLSRRQQILDDYEIVADMSGQYSATPLLSSEEFGYGGPAFGRAYDPSEIVGDKGFSAALELRRAPYSFAFIDVQPYIFYDFGKVWNIDTGQPKTESGASAGIGARASAENLSAGLTLAKPLTRKIETPQGYSDADGPRVQVNLTAKY